MGDDSERLHLEGLDEATERERWEEHFAPMVSVPAEKIAALREALDFFAEAENRVDLAARAVVDAATETEKD